MSQSILQNGTTSCQPKVNKNLVFYVNGNEIIAENVEPEWTLLFYLRNKLNIYGTKLGCAEGGCGACTVMISKYERTKKKITHLAANACLLPICSVHGMAVTTVEGIGSAKTKLHPVQERIAKAHGTQCGFCTPGFVMSMYALLRSKALLKINDIEEAFQGNLCRCTGYRPIIDGYKTFTEKWKINENNANTCSMGNGCCKQFTSKPCESFDTKDLTPIDPLQEPIFPSKLQLFSDLDDENLIIEGSDVTWYRPTNLKSILELKFRFPHAKIVVGNTEIGVETKFKNCKYPVLIHPIMISEMRNIKKAEDGVEIGASVTLTEMEEALVTLIKIEPEARTRVFVEIVKMLNRFAGKQIRNFASVGGNIMTGSPISDLNPIFLALGIKLNLSSYKRGSRTIHMDQNFFTGYRKNSLKDDEVLVSIEIPFSQKNQYFLAYKQSKRRDDDIAIVNFAQNIFFEDDTTIVKKILMAFGGMSEKTILAQKTCSLLVGKNWDKKLIEEVTNSLLGELLLSDDAPGGMILYRKTLALSLFFKGFIKINEMLKENDSMNSSPDASDIVNDYHFSTSSSQYYQVSDNENCVDLIGHPIVHMNSFIQATGEAIYTDDIPRIEGELYLSLVLSTEAHATIHNIDPSNALSLKGVTAFFSAKDIPDDQRFIGCIIDDEEVFASTEVKSHGQLIGAIVAVDQATAKKAAKLVKVDYTPLQSVITIEDAIKSNSYYEGYPKILQNGNIEDVFKKSNNIIEGEVRIGGQEHFYLETQCSLAVPKEGKEIHVFSATQNPTRTQKLIARVLNIDMNRVNLRVKRLGGGFGGKETRDALLSIPVALAAHKLGKPVRCMLDRDEDMMITGTRHPFLSKYKVAFTDTGVITGAEIHMYCNAGYSLDLSPAVLECAMLYFANAYKVPVVKIFAYLCKTNLPSNTAFRGFGGPQGMFLAENIIRHIAHHLNRDEEEITMINLYKDGDLTFYNQKIENCSLKKCWDECLERSNYKENKKLVEQFNKEHRYRKKGISMVPVMFGIGYEKDFLNQGGALVHVYTDGSVLLSHGGVEMGQGLYTKMIQVASKILKVNPDKIYTSETGIDKVPNTLATAASLGSDINGMAILNACNKIMKRIQHIVKANPNGSWEEWVDQAFIEKISLSATGFYFIPDLGYDLEKNTGKRFNYYTYGAACSQVEIDCLTGDHEVLRTDIVMDIGQSLNPAIDIGQIEGAFMQGYGLFMLEELIYSQTGALLSKGPGSYKIPSVTNIPKEFNVSLLKGVSNPRAVFSSKAVGEPPLFLASSVFFAIKNAVKDARRDERINDYFKLDSPASTARVRMACIDQFTKMMNQVDENKAWNLVP